MRVPPAAGIAAGAALVAALGVVLALTLGGDDESVAISPTPTPTRTATPVREPTATPTPTPTPEPDPFAVRLAEREDGLEIASTDNAAILSRPELEIDEEVAAQAAEIARAAFESFLNAQFVDPATRFGPEPIDALLTPAARAALTDEDRTALGQLGDEVARVVPGAAEVNPLVTMHGERPRSIALAVAANMTAVAADGAESPLRLRGQLLFVPTEDGWLVHAAQVTLAGEEGA